MTRSATTTAPQRTAASFLLTGQVQGIGLRPAIALLAQQLGVSGSVANHSTGVFVHVEGDIKSVEAFATRVCDALPERGQLDSLKRLTAEVNDRCGFQVETGSSSNCLGTHVPRDLATCQKCRAEVCDSVDRRSGYPLASCTDCGPRYSIIESMPYERAETSMAPFVLCPHCNLEFTSSRDRRFHAQTNACPTCGPALWATTPEGEVAARDHEAVRFASAKLMAGEIVAIKGVGGFQLVCDATNVAAIQRLRQRKGRPSKPFAIMLDRHSLSGVTPEELQHFDGSANPIVLIARSSVVDLPDNVAPGLTMLGVMRPSTPLHWLLLTSVGRPLIVTSSNVVGEPLAYANCVAQKSLQAVADILLLHDRNIVRPIDDSVVRVIAGRCVTIRAARGIAPLPLPMISHQQVLAVGGHQKVALALSNGEQSILGPHIGDMNSLASRTRFVEQSEQLLQLYGGLPEAIAHDLHPDYFTTRWAEEQGVPMVAVQHHHAHVAAGMLEHGLLDRTVLGVAFDGTGYGTDGTIWGGEVLLATAAAFRRVGSLRPFILPGGELGIREPWRVAAAILVDACGVSEAASVVESLAGEQQVRTTLRSVERGLGPRSTSVGRLFDAVACLVLNVKEVSFEGEAAMRFEAICDLNERGEYDLPLVDCDGITRIDWRVMVRQLVGDVLRGISPGAMSMRFHRGVAASVARFVAGFREYPVVLSGGCFQNRVLTELISERLSDHPRQVCLPGVIPPNDGGLAAGQLAVALARLSGSSVETESR